MRSYFQLNSSVVLLSISLFFLSQVVTATGYQNVSYTTVWNVSLGAYPSPPSYPSKPARLRLLSPKHFYYSPFSSTGAGTATVALKRSTGEMAWILTNFSIKSLTYVPGSSPGILIAVGHGDEAGDYGSVRGIDEGTGDTLWTSPFSIYYPSKLLFVNSNQQFLTSSWAGSGPGHWYKMDVNTGKGVRSAHRYQNLPVLCPGTGVGAGIAVATRENSTWYVTEGLDLLNFTGKPVWATQSVNGPFIGCGANSTTGEPLALISNLCLPVNRKSGSVPLTLVKVGTGQATLNITTYPIYPDRVLISPDGYTLCSGDVCYDLNNGSRIFQPGPWVADSAFYTMSQNGKVLLSNHAVSLNFTALSVTTGNLLWNLNQTWNPSPYNAYKIRSIGNFMVQAIPGRFVGGIVGFLGVSPATTLRDTQVVNVTEGFGTNFQLEGMAYSEEENAFYFLSYDNPSGSSAHRGFKVALNKGAELPRGESEEEERSSRS